MKASLVILTMNRKRVVFESLAHNLEHAGRDLFEIVHVDNGSDPEYLDEFRRRFKPAVQVAHRENLGVAKGYNRGMLLATGEFITIVGCDRLMPHNWLLTFEQCYRLIPNTGVISVYSPPLEKKFKDRLRGEPFDYGNRGFLIQRAIPFEARIHRREFLLRTGLFREDFGLYGTEDCEWAGRAERVAGEEGLINYTLPGMVAEHLDWNDKDIVAKDNDGKDLTYRQWKDSLVAVHSRNLWRECERSLYPYYNPYSRIERGMI